MTCLDQSLHHFEYFVKSFDVGKTQSAYITLYVYSLFIKQNDVETTMFVVLVILGNFVFFGTGGFFNHL